MIQGKRPWWRLPLCWLELCPGRVASGWDDDGWSWTGWRCEICGRLEHKIMGDALHERDDAGDDR